MADRIVIVAA